MLPENCTLVPVRQLCTLDGDYGPGWNLAGGGAGRYGTFDDWKYMNLTAKDACCGCGGGRRDPSSCENHAFFADSIGNCHARAVHRLGCQEEIVRFYCPRACGLCSAANEEHSDALLQRCEDDRNVQLDCDAFALPAAEEQCSNEALSASLRTHLESQAVSGFQLDVFERFRARCPFTCRLCSRCPQGSRLELRYRSYDPQVCQQCPPGQYQPLQYSTSCFDCEPGLFAEDSGSLYCTRCPPGHTSPRAAPNCSLCPAGSIPDALGAFCELCPVGSTSTDVRHRCETCGAGRFAPHAGSPDCNACEPGFFSPSGSATCIACQLGQFSARYGSGSCDWCQPGSYSNVSGSSVCMTCKFGSTTVGRGGTASADCQCPEGKVFRSCRRAVRLMS